MNRVGNTTADETLLIGDQIRIRIKNGITNSDLCNSFLERVIYLNVTQLLTPGSLSNIRDLCLGTATFSSISNPVVTSSQPSQRPSGMPTSVPTNQPTLAPHAIVTSGFIGFLCMILLIALLRFHPIVTAFFAVKKGEKEGHLYDILMVLNEDEEAIIENIRHEDIVLFRRTNCDNDNQSYTWMMNATSEILEKRFEVQFFDQYDLLGQGGLNNREDSLGHAVLGDKLVTKEVYVHEAKLHTGMIIKVKSLAEQKLQQKQKQIEYDESDAESATTSKEYYDTPDSSTNSVSCSRYSVRSSHTKGRVGADPFESSWSEKNHHSYAGSYDDGISDDESENYISGRSAQTGCSYGLKHEDYCQDSCSEDSVDLTSIDLPLDGCSFSDINPMMRKTNRRSGSNSVGSSSRGDSYERQDVFEDQEVFRTKHQFSRRGSNFSTTSAVSSISSKSTNMNSNVAFIRPRTAAPTRNENFRDEELTAKDSDVTLANILRGQSSALSKGKEMSPETNKRAQMGRDLKALTASMANPDLFGERDYDDESDDSHSEKNFPVENRRYSLASAISVPFMHYEDENAEQRQI